MDLDLRRTLPDQDVLSIALWRSRVRVLWIPRHTSVGAARRQRSAFRAGVSGLLQPRWPKVVLRYPPTRSARCRAAGLKKKARSQGERAKLWLEPGGRFKQAFLPRHRFEEQLGRIAHWHAEVPPRSSPHLPDLRSPVRLGRLRRPRTNNAEEAPAPC